MTHYPNGTDADYYAHDKQPTSFRCSCGQWFLTRDSLSRHIEDQA